MSIAQWRERRGVAVAVARELASRGVLFDVFMMFTLKFAVEPETGFVVADYGEDAYGIHADGFGFRCVGLGGLGVAGGPEKDARYGGSGE